MIAFGKRFTLFSLAARTNFGASMFGLFVITPSFRLQQNHCRLGKVDNEVKLMFSHRDLVLLNEKRITRSREKE